ncbi:hypothetical protein [Nitrososphaera viennensis]|uniref:Uncharacterized protein n=2 Tax=Nitrososphaera viennensis TaxID=1034015 RepID=A0A060HW07_9ARCH|nr:hypothetical protein [Nitrososphaera viennensis]AIC17222.1 conserved exported protein of unknown function [Nitrososphaera viennensis EN76]UVS69109.1 hypothetical protein NWT39_14540 [Nitrososphaera viennensis]
MVNKFVFAIAGIVIVMAVLIAIPNISQQPAAQDITIEYNRQHLTKTEGGGLLVTTQLETLTIDKDGSATYTNTDPRQKNMPVPQRFSLNRDEFTRIKGLVLETGFMDIPKTDYPQSQNASNNFVSYTLSVKTPDRQKTISWVEPDAYDGTIPSLITQVGTQLDGIIASKT